MLTKPVNCDLYLDDVDDEYLSHLQNGDKISIWPTPDSDLAILYAAGTMGGLGRVGHFSKANNPLVAALLDASEKLWMELTVTPDGSRNFRLVREDRGAEAFARRAKLIKKRKVPDVCQAELTYLEGWVPSIGDTLEFDAADLEFYFQNANAALAFTSNRRVLVAEIRAQARIRDLVIHAKYTGYRIRANVTRVLEPRLSGSRQHRWMAQRAAVELLFERGR